MIKPIDVGHLMVRDLPGLAVFGAHQPFAAVFRMSRSLPGLPIAALPMPALDIAQHMPALMAGRLAGPQQPFQWRGQAR